MWGRGVFLLFVVLSGLPSLQAQFLLRGTISGLVTDPTGAVVPAARVVLTEVERNQTFEGSTNASGLFSFPNLTAGNYQVTVEQSGFSKAVSDIISITTNDNARVDMTLQVGEVTETVEVTSSAPLIQTEQTVVGQVVDQQLVEELPAFGRNFTAFAALAPNVSSFPRSAGENATWAVGSHHTIGGTPIMVGGGGDNGLYMNGVNINDSWLGGTQYSPSMENVQEVKVDSANFSASTGRDISSVSVTTKSGTNEFHGTLFNYLQNEALNAWHPFVKAESEPGQEKDILRRNQFGGNIGGPVVIPKLFNGRDRAFFFVGYEGFDNNTGGSSSLYRVPTSAERQGDFSHLLSRFPDDPNVILYNPFTTTIDADGNTLREPVINNDLRTTGMIDPRAQEQIGALFPDPSGFSNPANPSDLRNHRTTGSRGNFNWRMDTRFDYRITDNDNIYVAYSESSGKDTNTGGLFPELPENVEDTSYIITLSYARVFTPTLTNDFVFGWGRPGINNIDQGTRDYMHDPDTPRNRFFNNLGNDVDFGFHRISMDGNQWGDSRVGYDEVLTFDNPNLQFSNNTSWLRGDHSMKWGFNFVRKGERVINLRRQVIFDATATRSGSVDESVGGDPVASWLLGVPTSIRQSFAFEDNEQPWTANNQDVWGFYFEDKWQLSPKLTFTAGLRYDLQIPVYGPNRFCCATIDFNYPGWQLAIPGRAAGYSQKWAPADKNNWAPRLALAYRVKPDLVVRASYGIFYMGGIQELRARNTSNVASADGEEFNNARFGVNDDIPYLSFNDIFPTQNSFKLGTYPVSTGEGTGYFDGISYVEMVDKASSVDPYFQRWTIDIQKGLGQSTALTLSYNGSRGTKLPYRENLNAPAYQTGWTSEADVDAARPNNNGRFSDVRVTRHGNNSFYNAGTIKLERRMDRGLQFVTHYTWSKTVTDYVLFTPEFLPGGASFLNYDYNRHLGRGEGEFSHPHRWLTAVLWEPPWGANLPAFPKALLNGWTISFITTLESGNSITPENAQSSARDLEPDRPNLLGNPNLSRGERTQTRFFDAGVFADPGQDVKGTAGLGIIRGPGQNNWNVNLAKTFRPTERVNVEFRAEFYNAFNHTQYSDVNRWFEEFSGSTFGWATWARDPRVMQMGLRLTF
jgi:outer membrane receptor protein involved in Fe transport